MTSTVFAEKPELVPLTVTTYTPPEPLQESVEVALAPAGGVTLVGLTEQDSPVDGFSETERATN